MGMFDGLYSAAVCVHVHTGRWPQEYDWNFDNDPDTAMAATPAASPKLGGGSWWANFMGGIAVASLHRSVRFLTETVDDVRGIVDGIWRF